METVSLLCMSYQVYKLICNFYLFIYTRSYSNLSLLYVTGLIRLDPSFEATTSTATTLPRSEFDDVWPTKAQRKAALIATQRSVGSYVDYGYIYDDSYFHHSSSDESEDE